MSPPLVRFTGSERLLADYLTATGRVWVREPLLGTAKPDFLVDGEAVCEVTSFKKGHLPEQVGARDALHPLRQKIRDKWRQAESAKEAGYPFLLVLHQEGHETDLNVETLAAALFGDLSVSGTFDPAGGTLRLHAGFSFGETGSAELGNRNLSAVAILRRFNPTLVELFEAWGDARVEGSVAEKVATRAAIEEQLIASGRFRPNETATRLILIHTCHPAISLPVGWLGGLYDEEWGIHEETAALTRIHVGPLHDRVPQR